MNEQIEKFAEQCGFRSNPDLYDRNQSFDIPKFAELIVRECCEVAHCNSHVGGLTLGNIMKEHFGVKE